MLSRICHHTKVLRRCWPVIASNGRFLSVTGGNYSLPEPKWSVKALNLLDDNGDGVVQIDTVERLADLACIDLKYISSNGDHMATKEMICKDVNVILKCAQSLKVGYILFSFIHFSCASLSLLLFLSLSDLNAVGLSTE